MIWSTCDLSVARFSCPSRDLERCLRKASCLQVSKCSTALIDHPPFRYYPPAHRHIMKWVAIHELEVVRYLYHSLTLTRPYYIPFLLTRFTCSALLHLPHEVGCDSLTNVRWCATCTPAPSHPLHPYCSPSPVIAILVLSVGKSRISSVAKNNFTGTHTERAIKWLNKVCLLFTVFSV